MMRTTAPLSAGSPMVGKIDRYSRPEKWGCARIGFVSAMKITFYHTSMCPRCAHVRKHLRALLGNAYTASCIEIDSLVHPLKTWQDGVRMIPALKIDRALLSGVLLSEKQVRAFLIKQGMLDGSSAP